ncbi:MAG: aconitate hydratase AcnA [Clostridiales bacterium]|nr:aconitate hydratase AcnA [Clostridiales bacterium]
MNFPLRTLTTRAGTVGYYRLEDLEKEGLGSFQHLPYSIRILLENMMRHLGGVAGEGHLRAVLSWGKGTLPDLEVPFMPARVILQDFTGVPCVVDLAAMRDAMAEQGGDPSRINPVVPVDLVIDHSVQVDMFGSEYAFFYNVKREFERNFERYTLLRWAQKAFRNFRVVPPGTGIVHQVNLEYLAKVVQTKETPQGLIAFPDSLVGTDSHTTMINGIGVFGWGVGGIEAEAVMLGEPYSMLLPEVVGFRLVGELREGVTATDLVLTVTEILRKKGVVGKFVEFFGPGLSQLTVADRATIGNMSPEYGATMGFFPVDENTLDYLRSTGRDEELIDLVERYCKEQGLFRTPDAPEPAYSDVVELDLSTVESSMAGPRRPQDRWPLSRVPESFRQSFGKPAGEPVAATPNGHRWENEGGKTVAVATRPELKDGDVVIAAITSCTNTSNPTVMVGAGLLAKKAVERGLKVPPYVKTSLAPGSRVVTQYLREAGLLDDLEKLGFYVVGYGCTTCIGNSGTLIEEVAREVESRDLAVVAVLSGNRNFEGRINPLVKANYLASPPLVVAYAIAGSIHVDLTRDPLGYDPEGRPVYLRDIWPTHEEIHQVITSHMNAEMFKEQYSHVFEGDEQWQSLPVPEGELYRWDENSTYIRRPPYFDGMSREPKPLEDIVEARVLALLGDSITTDHISPAGAIPKHYPAGRYLLERGVDVLDFNTYGSRRGNHEVMVRGTFANIRLRNKLVDREGGYTRHMPSGEEMFIYDAAMRYQKEGVPLVVLAGKEYGSGSSRDWAAKGTILLGVRAVLAQSFERIHRANLVGMGVLPLEFMPGESVETLGLTGEETYTIRGLADLKPREVLVVEARRPSGEVVRFKARARIDTPVELRYFRHGGILPAVLREFLPS